MHALFDEVKRRLQSSLLLRLALLTCLGIALQAPIAAIEGTIYDREATRQRAIQEVTETWGSRQTLAGPLLVVPYVERWRDKKKVEYSVTRYAYFLPDSLHVKGGARVERRYRGIFEIPLYEADLEISGEFHTPDLSGLSTNAPETRWDLATLVVGLTDPKALRDQVNLTWDDHHLPFEPGGTETAVIKEGIHVALAGRANEAVAQNVHRFNFRLKYGGSSLLQILPFGSNTDLELASAWRDPSFTGSYLPAERSLSDNGFKAHWRVPHLGRGYPNKWTEDAVKPELLDASAFGVSFFTPVDAYTATTRAVKYEVLFVFLTFMVFYLFEVFHRVRIHPVQYLLVGGALCLFYLLLLALSEHVGFATAYLAAGISVVLVTTGYCFSIVGARLAAIVAGELALLYSFLYVLLQVEDFALLVGSLGLFLVLVTVMFVTRKINWYKIGAFQEPQMTVSPAPR